MLYCLPRLYRLTVRTAGFHPANRGSIPRRVTKRDFRSARKDCKIK